MEKTSTNVNVRQFLKTGEILDADISEMAAACDREIQTVARRSITSALDLARRFVKQTENAGGPMALTAFRVLARMTHLGGSHAEALTAYLNARKLAWRDPLLRGRIDRALIDVNMYLGDFKQAGLAARRSLAAFKKIGADADLARTRVNYANLLHRRDKHRDAERLYARAAAFFKSSGDSLAAAKCNFNRANGETYEFGQLDSLGNLTWMLSPQGDTTRYEFDDYGRLLKLTLKSGQNDSLTTSYERNYSGNITKVTYPKGNSIEYDYDDNGLLTDIENLLGEKIHYEYDAYSRCSLEVVYDDQDNIVKYERYLYTPRGQLYKIKFSDSTYYEYEYDDMGNCMTTTDANGHVTTYTMII